MRRINRNDLMQQFIGRAAPKRFLAGQQFVQNDTQRKDIAAAIQSVSFTTSLFGTHVGRCAGDPVLLR